MDFVGPCIQTGEFTADGADKEIIIRADADRIVIENQTEIAATNSGHGFRYTWHESLARNMFMEYHPAADHTSAIDVVSDRFLITMPFYSNGVGELISITAGTNATQPVYSTSDTSNLIDGSIVSIYDTDQENLNRFYFSVTDVIANTSFKLKNALATAPGITAGAGGSYMVAAKKLFGYDEYFESVRNISNVTQAGSAVVTTIVDHSFSVGQNIKFIIPAVYGMVELDGLCASITAITATTFTVSIDSTAFTAFTFPVYTDAPFDKAFAEATEFCYANEEGVIYDLDDSVSGDELACVVISLKAGATGPAGLSGDKIRWTAYNAIGEDLS